MDLSTLLSKKIRLIRKSEALTQKQLCEVMGWNLRTLTRYELGERLPDFRKLQELAQKYPQYALWLLTDKVDLPNHTSPEIVMKEREVGNKSQPKTA